MCQVWIPPPSIMSLLPTPIQSKVGLTAPQLADPLPRPSCRAALRPRIFPCVTAETGVFSLRSDLVLELLISPRGLLTRFLIALLYSVARTPGFDVIRIFLFSCSSIRLTYPNCTDGLPDFPEVWSSLVPSAGSPFPFFKLLVKEGRARRHTFHRPLPFSSFCHVLPFCIPGPLDEKLPFSPAAPSLPGPPFPICERVWRGR